MYKHDYDFGFEIVSHNDTNYNNSTDILEASNASLFLDFKDCEDVKNERCNETEFENIRTAPIHISPISPISDPNYPDLDLEKNHFSPHISTRSLDFGNQLLSIISKFPNSLETYNTLYEFAINASPELLKFILESIENPTEVANAIRRLRSIIGVAEFDPYLDYQYYYIFSCCNDKLVSIFSDWENIISLTMAEIVEHIFTGSIYLLIDHEINIILLPADIATNEFEKDFIASNRIWGVKMKQNPLDKLNSYLCIEESLDDEGQEIQFQLMHKFMCNFAHKFPNLSGYKLGNMFHINSYLTRFNWIIENINSFLKLDLDLEIDSEADTLLQFIRPDKEQLTFIHPYPNNIVYMDKN